MSPTISVLMPVYNGERYIRGAVQSILNQTYSDFELLILDDGSTDDTISIINSFADERIRLIPVNQHRGISYVLNEGLALAKGAFLARMDADDDCHPTRFALQMEYLSAHPEVLLCGTNMSLMGSDEVWDLPAEHETIRANLLFSNVISHPSILMRRVEFRYSYDHPHAEDYALWIDLIEQGQFHNLPQRLYHYRIHQDQVSTARRALQQSSAKKVHRELLTRFGIPFDEADLDLHTNFTAYLRTARLDEWFQRIIDFNETVQYYSPESLVAVIRFVREHYYHRDRLEQST